ncbi:MAG: glycosyltransferase family 4 protein [Patescibacteria group bacterium]
MAKILICTGIYPPQIGGPAQYAKETADEFRRQGHKVKVLKYNLERKLPTLVRHELFFWRTLFYLWRMRGAGDSSDIGDMADTDFVLALDTFSVGWPAVTAAKIAGKKILIRTGGDFLWESYVERTGDLILLKDFYAKNRGNWNWKERIIFEITKWTLQNASAVIFSTEWQRKIFEQAYGLAPGKNFIVENFYGRKLTGGELPTVARKNRTFIAGVRNLKWKNLERLKHAFEEAVRIEPTINLDLSNAPYEQFLAKIQAAYAVILVSLGDISPNMILDAIRANTPFILTRETGLYERLKDIGLFADPENIEDIKEKILYLADVANYRIVKEKIENFNFTHSWGQICDEILAVAGKKTTEIFS